MLQVTTIYGSDSNVLSTLAAPTAESAIGVVHGWDGSQPQWMSPFKYLYEFDDFITNATSSKLNWLTGTSGTGAAITIANNTSANPGVQSFATGTTNSGNSGTRLSVTMLTLGGGRIILTYIVRVVTASNGTDTFVTRFGMGDSTGADMTNGVYFECDQNANANWLIKTAKAGTRTTTTTSTAVDNTAFHRFTIDINAAGSSVTYYIDDISVGTINTNLPTATTGIVGMQILKTAGTTSVSNYLDLFVIYQN